MNKHAHPNNKFNIMSNHRFIFENYIESVGEIKLAHIYSANGLSLYSLKKTIQDNLIISS